MEKKNRLYRRLKMLAGVFALMAVLTAGLTMDAFMIVSLADSAGKITANSAKIRKSPSTSSDTLASAAKGNTVSVKGQIKGSDGMIWYQVVVNGSSTGYIRSDLMEITDGSTPATLTETDTAQTGTAQTSTATGTVDGVTAVEPIGGKASVSSTTGVRVRQKASATSQIISTVQDGHTLTVIGTTTGTEGKEWYQVTFTSNGSEVNGFIRSDYVSLDGELVPAGTASGQEEQPEQNDTQQAEEETKPEVKDGWETYYQDEKWHLKDNSTGYSYDIDNIFTTVQANNEAIQKVMNTNRILQIVAVSLGILSAVLLSIVSVVLFKMKEVKDEAYYAEVEQDTLRRKAARQGQKPQNGQRPVSAQGGTRQQAGGNGGQRPSGARMANGGGQRPAPGGNGGQRPANGGNGSRPAAAKSGNGQRPATVKGADGQQQAAPQNGNQNRPAQKSRQAVPTEHAVRQRPVEDPDSGYIAEDAYQEAQQPKRPQGSAPRQMPGKAKRNPRNFADDGGLEYQFLDWDDDQE